MDYKRVYRAFIKDRREKEKQRGWRNLQRAVPPDYFEKHHIVPKSMGGTRAVSNLIRLTPEDHFFAHLILAKAYGGRNWASLHAMCYILNDSTKEYRPRLRMRFAFGHIRRALADYYRSILSGPDGKIADKKKYVLKHFDGRRAKGNRFELEAATGIKRQSISHLIHGTKKSYFGWYSFKHNPNGWDGIRLQSENSRDRTLIKLYHYDGRSWEGTQWDFRRKFGYALVFQHPKGCCHGWYRTKAQARSHGSLRKSVRLAALIARGDIRGASNPNADPKKYAFKHLPTGKVIRTTKVEIKKRYGVTSVDICALFSGKQTHARGKIALAR